MRSLQNENQSGVSFENQPEFGHEFEMIESEFDPSLASIVQLSIAVLKMLSKCCQNVRRPHIGSLQPIRGTLSPTNGRSPFAYLYSVSNCEFGN